jgi:hypothetical protein
MEDQRFDALVRAVAAGATRRRMLGAVVGGLVALGGRQLTEAKPNKGNKSNKPNKGNKGNKGNSACAHFCNAVFPPGKQRGKCKSAAAHGEGLCAACGADSANVCLDADGQPTCDCGCPDGRVELSNGTCAVPCPPGGDCSAVGCAANRCIGTNEGNVCSLGQGSGGCNNSNADCPTGRACSGAICELVC